MKKISYFISLLVSLYFASYMAVAHDEIQQEDLCYPDGCQALLEQADKYGPQILEITLNVPGIENFKTKFGMSSEEFDEMLQRRKKAIDEVRNPVLTRLKSYNIQLRRVYETAPGFSVVVDADGIKALMTHPHVKRISPVKMINISLAQSAPLVKSPQIWEQGYSGKGYTVAVLDTGVDSTHPFLKDKVVAQACFSTTASGKNANGSWEAFSLCPTNPEISPGQPCEDLNGCDHGTHVAGIVAGKNETFSGIAKDADIIAVQIFSKVKGEQFCGSNNLECKTSFFDDQIDALKYISKLHRKPYNISAINMSIAGGYSEKECDDSSEIYASILSDLKAQGIATIISSGNKAYLDGLEFPACFSSAISVGSTTKYNSISSFSNTAHFLDILAPGSDINSSVLDDKYDYKSGTSMAAPHVAGAFAVMRQQYPDVSVDELVSLMKVNGIPITDKRDSNNPITKPRLKFSEPLKTTHTFAHALIDTHMDSESNSYTLYNTMDYSVPNGGYLAKYNSEGELLWKTDTGITHSMAMDTANNSYVLSYKRLNKYNSDGQRVWSTGALPSAAYGITVNKKGEAYLLVVVGESMCVEKYTPEGSLNWITCDPEKSKPIYDSTRLKQNLMVLDKDEHVYVAGKRIAEVFNTKILKFTPDGKIAWSWSSDEKFRSFPTSLAIDKENNLYVSGFSCPFRTPYCMEFPPSMTNPVSLKYSDRTQLALLKFNPAGSLQWGISDAYEQVGAVAEKVVLDEEGNAYVGGNICVKADTECLDNDFIVASYNPDGKLRWSSITQGEPGIFEGVTDLSYDSYDKALHVTGYACLVGSEAGKCSKIVSRTLSYSTAFSDANIYDNRVHLIETFYRDVEFRMASMINSNKGRVAVTFFSHGLKPINSLGNILSHGYRMMLFDGRSHEQYGV